MLFKTLYSFCSFQYVLHTPPIAYFLIFVNIFVLKPVETRPLERQPIQRFEDNIKWILINKDWKVLIDSCGSRRRPVPIADSYKHGNALWGFIKHGEFIS